MDTALLNKTLSLILSKQLHNRVGEWETNTWSTYLELCRQQEYEYIISRKYNGKIECIYIKSKNTGTTVGRYCEYMADVTELGTPLGSPGIYEHVFDAFVRFVRKFYRLEISKVKPEYVCQKRKTLT